MIFELKSSKTIEPFHGVIILGHFHWSVGIFSSVFAICSPKNLIGSSHRKFVKSSVSDAFHVYLCCCILHLILFLSCYEHCLNKIEKLLRAHANRELRKLHMSESCGTVRLEWILWRKHILQAFDSLLYRFANIFNNILFWWCYSEIVGLKNYINLIFVSTSNGFHFCLRSRAGFQFDKSLRFLSHQ